ncbi:FHA domain-containing protein, partial [Bacillus thuringiensis]
YGGVELADLGSANGTFVTQKTLRKGRRAQLAEGDVIKFANEVFQVFEG